MIHIYRLILIHTRCLICIIIDANHVSSQPQNVILNKSTTSSGQLDVVNESEEVDEDEEVEDDEDEDEDDNDNEEEESSSLNKNENNLIFKGALFKNRNR